MVAIENRLFFLFFILFVNSLSAEEFHGEYKISLVGLQMDYREYDTNSVLLDSEKSSFNEMMGAEFEYRYFLDESINLELKVLMLSGTTNYMGSLIGSNQGYGSSSYTTSNDIRDITFMYNAKQISDFGINMLCGLGGGYRFWQRKLSASQIEQYDWYSLRGNIGIEYNLDTSVILKVLLEYQYGIAPSMKTNGIDGSFKLGSADILQISVPLRYEINKHFSLTCEYLYEYQKITKSNYLSGTLNGIYSNSWYEPDSSASDQYLKVGMIFKY